MGVQGFPTLKIVRPGSKKGKPIVEDYQGPRTAKAIVEGVVDKINNHVKRISDKDFDEFLATKNDSTKAILFTEKGTTSALLKSVAIDFLDVIPVAQVRSTQKAAVEMFGIEKFPTLVLLPGGDKDGIVYDGELKKAAMVEFLSQAGSPNPDPAPKEKSKTSSAKKPDKTAASEPSGEAEEKVTEKVEDPHVQKPVIFEGPLPIPIINEEEKLVKNCLSPKSHTCLLAFVPKEKRDDSAEKVLASLAELSHKHAQAKRQLFPMYEVHTDDAHSEKLLKALDISGGDVHVLAINARRGWWRSYDKEDYGHEPIESWVDQIRMGEGTKQKLPEAVVVSAVDSSSESAAASEATPEASSEPTPEATGSEATDTTAPPEAEVTPDAEKISDTATEEPTSWKGADPTVQEDTAAEEATGDAHVKDEL